MKAFKAAVVVGPAASAIAAGALAWVFAGAVVSLTPMCAAAAGAGTVLGAVVSFAICRGLECRLEDVEQRAELAEAEKEELSKKLAASVSEAEKLASEAEKLKAEIEELKERTGSFSGREARALLAGLARIVKEAETNNDFLHSEEVLARVREAVRLLDEARAELIRAEDELSVSCGGVLIGS